MASAVRLGRSGEFAKVVGKVPRKVAGTADIPKREQAADLSRVLCQQAQCVSGQHIQRRWHNRSQQIIHRLIVAIFRPIRRRDQVHVGAGFQQRQGKIVIDVGIHSGQRELNAIDVRSESGLKHRGPGRRRLLSSERSAKGVEVKPCEHHVEMIEPLGVLPCASGRVRTHLVGDHQVEAVKPFETVVVGKKRVDGLHLGDDVGDRGWVGGCDEPIARRA